ncbi:MAG: bifunctional chorismate mutase/prephenate dehydratase [Christensenellales bacterium]|jgi:chorismate mutase/prephenate dehydratase|nr:prephenate dehydratase domain-containing protein [Clostridia bacterium]HRU84346.1 prephenate dehydratase domain-containing protein [Eubacteriales bacterium]
MDLSELRNEIDLIDDGIAELFVKRMETVKKVGIEKGKAGLPIENTLREKEVLTRVTKTMPPALKLYAKQVFETLFNIGKAYQSELIDLRSAIKSELTAAILDGIKPFPDCASVACQGLPGAYSTAAADRLFSIADIMYFKDFDAVFGAVERGLCEFGVLPIENSSTGSVNAVYDLMRKHSFYIARSIKLKVQHYLLAKNGIKISDVKEIFSHEQAIGQCAEYLKSLKNVKVTVCDNTAVAAQLVAESGRTDVAAICARECAGIYGLSVVQPNIQDNDSNYTRFIAISKKLKVYENSDKISIMVNLPNTAGSLNRILNKFSAQGLNLTKLESRPLTNTPFEFAFYFDIDAKIEKREVLNLLSEIENTCDKFVFLGCYRELK